MREADTALFAAKAAGRAGWVVFDPSMNARARERLQLETDLRHAVERGELALHYQPEIDLNTGRIVGMEALTRWQHPHRGMIPPSEFIPIAEETGLILTIGAWALREACRQARRWQLAHPTAPPFVMAVNLSAQEFSRPTLVRDVARILEETGLPPAMLRLEITESVLMHSEAATTATLQALKGLGVKLAIDDFGIGYSSLSYLQHFPVDTLKIDRSFVQAETQDRRAMGILQAVKSLALWFEMDVTAEGIETERQLRLVRSMHCERGQGYLFSAAVPPETMAFMLGEDAVVVAPRRIAG